MAKKAEGRTFNIGVIGLSGTEREKGQYGVGKSCLCNRFLYQVADKYHTEHISVLSQSDFAGRVINNDHFLYWGEVTKTDEGNNFTFNVVEQTEFIDDVSFQPFKTGRTEPYTKRCVQTKVQSAEKLMYICKDQLGMESDYEQKLMPEGKLTIDGFICCFDVSQAPQRPVDKQVEFVAALLSAVLKAKKPLVLATTKHDDAEEHFVEKVEKLLNRREFKGCFPLVETSAHDNVNTELAFMTLAHLIDKTKARAKVIPFHEALKARQEILGVANKAYQNLLKLHVTDPVLTWQACRKKFVNEPDFGHYVDLFGTDKAKKLFRNHVKHLRDEQIQLKEQTYLSQIPKILKHFLPSLDAIGDRSWPTVQKNIQKHEDFSKYFVDACTVGQGTWKTTDAFLDSQDETRIPFDLLNSPDAETCFRNHVNELQANHRRKELQRQFKKLLEENHQVTAGKTLGETYVFFVGKEGYNGLEEQDRSIVYEQHQQELRQQAKHEFQELLWEQSQIFLNLNSTGRLTPEDLKGITVALQDDPRYKALYRLEEDRKVMILNHLGFIQCPSKDRCYFRENCVDLQSHKLLASRSSRPEVVESCEVLDGSERCLNLVLLGKDGLAKDVNLAIRNLCIDDEYVHESVNYSLDYRPIDGDVSLEHNALATANFKPHGCVCVYNSLHTLTYVRESLERSLFTDLEQDVQALNGMPIAVIQAYNSSQSEKEREILHDDGQNLARRLHGEFINIPEDIDEASHTQFDSCQIHRALQAVIRRCSSSMGGWLLSEHAQPDIRISVCMMCGDEFMVDVPLGPFLNNEFCRVSPKAPHLITLDTFLEYQKQRIEIEVSSYHGDSHDLQQVTHGYILVYSAKRKASLMTLRAFALRLPNVPKLILAVSDSSGASSFYSSQYSQRLITDGNSLADRIAAHFMTTTANFTQQTVYNPFFKEAWERKEESEDMFREPVDEQSPPAYDERSTYIDRRPPAPLPYNTYHTTKSSTSNRWVECQSTEDSEPLYDQPNLYQGRYPSDSDHERASSTSPVPSGEDIYAEVGPQSNGEHLVRPSYVKTRQHMHAVQQYKDHRKSLPILESSCDSSRLMSESTEFSDSDVQSISHFHKSSSMKLEMPVEPSAWALNEQMRRHHQRRYAAAAAAAACKQTSSSEDGWVDNNLYETAGAMHHHPGWADNDLYCHQSMGDSMDLRPRYGPVSPEDAVWADDLYSPQETRAHRRSQSRGSQGSHDRPKMSGGRVQAPLAVPEPIEIADYCTVKDAVNTFEPLENDYGTVQDALPRGKLHRVKSSSGKKEKGSDSEDSEFSSLERDRGEEMATSSRVNRRPTPYRKKGKQRSQDSAMQSVDKRRPIGLPRGTTFGGKSVRSNSPSEGSEGTGDELQGRRKEKKRRSFRRQKGFVVSQSPGRAISPPMSDSDHIVGSPPGRPFHNENQFEPVIPPYSTMPHSRFPAEETEYDGGNQFLVKLKSKTMRDPEKQRKKEEKRRQKEEEKRLKEERKMKKNPSKSSGPSQSGCCLEDFPTSTDNPLIPLFVEKCIIFIEQEGLLAEGIYRIPGNKGQVDLLTSKFNEDINTDIHSLDIQVNAVATILKQFFMDLTEPLIPVQLYDELIIAADGKDRKGVRDKSSRLLALRGVLKKLPDQKYKQNFEVLKYLITHLHRVSEHSEHNSMDDSNLARCWWPTLMRVEITSYEQMGQYSVFLVNIMQTLIEQYNFFFHGGDEV
ncbi:rho GTPase-activating protein 190-like isoform X3 [Haliotis cracherodii]|uniref:rho GTPase-activating protein 190-like isoform X3 n=1 Tax=Haliotis cracherodii TaxID=6455 RepID=UPI0039E8FB22